MHPFSHQVLQLLPLLLWHPCQKGLDTQVHDVRGRGNQTLDQSIKDNKIFLIKEEIYIFCFTDFLAFKEIWHY
jgi:hypothetical protein